MFIARQRWILMKVGLLGMVMAAGMMLYIITADIERLQAENKRISAEIVKLNEIIEHRTHPAEIQRAMFEWIAR